MRVVFHLLLVQETEPTKNALDGDFATKKYVLAHG